MDGILFLILLLEVGLLAGVKGRMGQRYIEHVQRLALAALQSQDLHAKPIHPADRAFTPPKGFGLVHYAAMAAAGDRLRHLGVVQIRIGGILRVLTLTMIPSYRYPMPFFVVDLVCLGSRRIAAFQIIDPAPSDPEGQPKDYPLLRACRAIAAARFASQDPLSGASAQGVLRDCSVVVRTDDQHERELLVICQAYLHAWLKLVQAAPPAPAAAQRQMQAGVEQYQRTLHDEGGPVVGFERYLMGPQRLDRWFSHVVFGTDGV